MNWQYFVAANYKYLKERYLNFLAAKQSSLVGTGGTRCFTLAMALHGCIPHRHVPDNFQSSSLQGSPRAGALLISANTSHAAPSKQAGSCTEALEFNTQCPALTTGLSLQRKHRHAPPPLTKLPFFPRHKWRTSWRQSD